MSDSQQPKTVAELQHRMEQGWDALNAALNQFDESEMTAVDPQSGWSIKDHLAHLTAWEAGIVEVLRNGNRATGMGLSDQEWIDLNMNQVNDVIIERNRDISLDNIRAHFETAHAGMVSAVAGMSDEDLFRSYATYQPDDPTYSGSNNPIIGWIIGDTYEHYEEHLHYLEGRLSSGD